MTLLVGSSRIYLASTTRPTWWSVGGRDACTPLAPQRLPSSPGASRRQTQKWEDRFPFAVPPRRLTLSTELTHSCSDEACTDSARVDRRDSCGPRRTSGGVDEADAKLTSMESMDFVCADCGNMIRYRDDTFRWRSQHKRTCRTWRTSLFNDELVVKGGLNSLRGATLRPSTSRASLTLVYSRPRAPRTLVSSRPASSRRRR